MRPGRTTFAERCYNRFLPLGLALLELLDEGDAEPEVAIDLAVHGFEILAKSSVEIPRTVRNEFIGAQQFLAHCESELYLL